MKEKLDPGHIRSEISLFYYGLKKDSLIQLEEYLKHSSIFLDSIDKKFDDMKIYSEDFFEYFYAGGYKSIFTEQFIISLVSLSEYKLKIFLEIFDYVLEEDELKKITSANNDVLTAFKKYSKDYLKIIPKFDGKEYKEFKELTSLRNIIVHSGSRLWLQRESNIAAVKELSKRYSDIKIYDDYVYIDIKFCLEAIEIVKRFFFLISKNFMREFPG